MGDKPSTSVDLLGLAPYGEALDTATKGLLEGAGAFLSRICLPAAEELGFLLRDRINHWRAIQLAKIADKARKKLEAIPDSENLHSHPRLVGKIVEAGSWIDSDEVQDMWAGLIASSCTEDGRDDSNLMFINLLSQLTTSQVKVLNYSCEKSEKSVTPGGWIQGSSVFVHLDELQAITEVQDLHRLDRELDHLRALDLIRSGFAPYSTTAEIGPTALALHLYVRCQGSLQSPVDYFGITAG